MDHKTAVEPKRDDMLGFFTHPGTAAEYLEFVQQSILSREQHTVLYHNLHTLYLYFKSPELKQSFINTTVIVDGMGVLFLQKLKNLSLSRDLRVTYVDLIYPMMQMAANRQWRVFHVGQDANVQAQALEIIRERVPGLQIQGHHGFFDQTANSDESKAVVDEINGFSTDLLLVGTGSPTQELWIAAHRKGIDAPMVMSCGSCMEYVAGKVNTAPRWMGRCGLEWLFRLFDDPRRFAFRYLIQPFLLMGILFRNWRTGTP